MSKSVGKLSRIHLTWYSILVQMESVREWLSPPLRGNDCLFYGRQAVRGKEETLQIKSGNCLPAVQRLGNRSKSGRFGKIVQHSHVLKVDFNQALSRKSIADFENFEFLMLLYDYLQIDLGRLLLLGILRWFKAGISAPNRSSNLWSHNQIIWRYPSNSPFPFMPFYFREIWHFDQERSDKKKSLILASWPKEKGWILKYRRSKFRFLSGGFPSPEFPSLRKEMSPQESLDLTINAKIERFIICDSNSVLTSWAKICHLSAFWNCRRKCDELRGEGWRMLYSRPVIWWIWRGKKKKILARIGIHERISFELSWIEKALAMSDS